MQVRLSLPLGLCRNVPSQPNGPETMRTADPVALESVGKHDLRIARTLSDEGSVSRARQSDKEATTESRSRLAQSSSPRTVRISSMHFTRKKRVVLGIVFVINATSLGF